jgi:hypothetical protein
MSAWKDLPNARHIDWVLASVKQHPDIWAASRCAARDAAWNVARDAIYDAGRYAAWYAACELLAACYANWNETYAATYAAAYAAARSAILALIAYDDCAHLLDMSSEQLKTWALLTEQPAAVLLLLAVIAREQIRELNMA